MDHRTCNAGLGAACAALSEQYFQSGPNALLQPGPTTTRPTHIAERRPSSRRGGYTALRPVLLNQSGVEAFRRALVRDKVFANRTLPYSGEYRWTLGSVCAVSEDLWIDFVDFLCKKTVL
ncbi:uncharacterized protein LOC144155846 isoform X4 [Haemaphysalis longicornis]